MSEPVVVKLVSGDLLMATVLNDTPESLILVDPVAVRTVHVQSESGLIERTVTNPFCTITDEREYSFDRRHVLFVKRLHPRVIKFYEELVKTLDEPEDESFELSSQEYVENDIDDEPDSILIIPDKNLIH